MNQVLTNLMSSRRTKDWRTYQQEKLRVSFSYLSDDNEPLKSSAELKILN